MTIDCGVTVLSPRVALAGCNGGGLDVIGAIAFASYELAMESLQLRCAALKEEAETSLTPKYRGMIQFVRGGLPPADLNAFYRACINEVRPLVGIMTFVTQQLATGQYGMFCAGIHITYRDGFALL